MMSVTDLPEGSPARLDDPTAGTMTEQMTLAFPGRRIRRTAPGMTEADLLAAVRKLAKLNGWRTYHTRDSRGSEPGWPDLVLANLQQRRVVFAELKAPGGSTTPEQDEWLAVLRAAGCEVALWRPADLPEIAAVLRGQRLNGTPPHRAAP